MKNWICNIEKTKVMIEVAMNHFENQLDHQRYFSLTYTGKNNFKGAVINMPITNIDSLTGRLPMSATTEEVSLKRDAIQTELHTLQ